METLAPAKKTSALKIVLIVVGALFGICVLCVGGTLVADKMGFIPTSTPTIPPLPTALPSATTLPTVPPLPTDTLVPAALPTPSIAKVGDQVIQGDYIITLVTVETAQTYGYFTADPGNILVAVELLIESNSNTGVNVNPFYIKVKDSDGYEYTTAIFGKEPALSSQNDLPQGEKMRGWITFQVPATAHGLILSYEPITLFNEIRIRFDLGL